MRLPLRVVAGLCGLLLFALLCVAMAGAEYSRGHRAALIVTSTADSGAGSLRASTTTATATPTLGDYSDTSVSLSGNTTIMPSATPANTTSINVSSDSNFKGTFAASPMTGVVTVTDAHPAGTYTVTVTAFGPGGTMTKTFTLTITSTPCGAGSTAGFVPAADVSVG